MKLIIRSKQIIATDIIALQLVRPDGELLPEFSAGSHIDISLNTGMVRSYSLCQSPKIRDYYQIAVLRAQKSRGGSQALHALAVGAELEVSEPKNRFALDLKATHSVLIAGGIGITPLLSMAETLLNLGKSFEIYYATKSASRTAFMARLSSPDLVDKTRFYFGNQKGGRLHVSSLMESLSKEAHIYVCGPEGLINDVLNEARTHYWAEDHLHYEFFSNSHVMDEADGFMVRLKRKDRLITVAPNQTIVEALEDQGIYVPTSCREGLCGTCLTKVISGVPDHRDMYLSAKEKASGRVMMPCVSRSLTSVIELDL